ncbi:MAG: hypothetical protein ACOX4C_07920 [Bacillota bacterium]
MRKYRSAHVVIAIALMLLMSACFGRGGTAPGTYTASGVVVDSDGDGIEGVTIAFSRGFGTATTNRAGKWSKNSLKGNATVTPSKGGYTFTPNYLEITGGSASVNFIGSNNAIAKGQLKVSFIGNTEPRVQSRVAMGDLTPFDPSVYVPPFNSYLEGNLVGRYTPHSMIGAIDGIGVASPNYRLPLCFSYGAATGPLRVPMKSST